MTMKEKQNMKPAKATDRAAPARAAKAAKLAAAKAAAAESATPSKKGPNWDGEAVPSSRFTKYKQHEGEWTDYSGEDRLHLDPDIIDALARDGLVCVWVAESCLGQPMDYEVSKFTRNGWQPLDADDAKSIGIGAVEIGGLRLMVRDKKMHDKALEAERNKARENVRIKEAGLISGDIPGVTLDSRHPSATRINKINRTYERLTVPEE
jgi:hypothetical protein